MRAGGPAIQLRGVSVTYPASRTPALEAVDLEVGAGNLAGLSGPTGAGKSTLALTAAGFIPRVVRATVAGAVTVGGRDALARATGSLAGTVGIVFATPANQLSASKLTVREELAFGLENLGVARSEMDTIIDRVLARLGIEDLAGREPFALSGGEQQRVAIASIVAMGTGALVLDEPTAQLDPSGTAAVADLLVELVRDGTAVLVAEHDPAVLAATGCVHVLADGRVARTGMPGLALGSPVLEPLGLRPPTLVALAEAAGLPPERAFDEAAIAEALDRGAAATADDGDRPSPAPPGRVWAPPRPVEPAQILVDGLVHTYPSGVEALRGVSLHVEPGESVAIVGENGSGKTTLVKHLVGLLRPTAGRVLVGPLDAAAAPIHRLATLVGFVFQNPDDQLFERSVEREVAFGPRTQGATGESLSLQVDRAIEAVGLRERRTMNPYDLDLSRRKLVGLASVLATNPAVLVLDEPTTGQDPAGVGRVGAILDAVRAAGRTVIAITHDMEFAATHFERIVVMRHGEVTADGPPDDVFAPARRQLLAATGLTQPPAARIAARLGLPGAPATSTALLAALATRAQNRRRAAG